MTHVPTWLLLILFVYTLRRWHRACCGWDEPTISAAFVRAFQQEVTAQV